MSHIGIWENNNYKMLYLWRKKELTIPINMFENKINTLNGEM